MAAVSPPVSVAQAFLAFNQAVVRPAAMAMPVFFTTSKLFSQVPTSQPAVSAMKAKLPPDVHMVYIPAAFGAMWDNYAKAYYTAEAMGLAEKTHDAMFRAIHIDKTLKGERGMDTPEQIAAFYAAYGADPKQFVSSMQSFAVAAKVNRGKQYILGAFTNGDTPSTPTFIVAGKYRVKGKTVDDMFRIMNQLVVAERTKKAAATPAPADAAAATTEAPAAAPAQQ